VDQSGRALEGINVNFILRLADYDIFIRVWVDEQTNKSQAFGEGIPVVWDRDLYAQ